LAGVGEDYGEVCFGMRDRIVELAVGGEGVVGDGVDGVGGGGGEGVGDGGDGDRDVGGCSGGAGGLLVGNSMVKGWISLLGEHVWQLKPNFGYD